MIGISFLSVIWEESINIFNIDNMTLFCDNKAYCHNNERTFSTTRGGLVKNRKKLFIKVEMKLVSGVVDHCHSKHIPHDLLGTVRNLGSKSCPSS